MGTILNRSRACKASTYLLSIMPPACNARYAARMYALFSDALSQLEFEHADVRCAEGSRCENTPGGVNNSRIPVR